MHPPRPLNDVCDAQAQQEKNSVSPIGGPSSCEVRRAFVKREHEAQMVIGVAEKGGEFPTQELATFISRQGERLEHESACRRCVSELELLTT
jgi:hypothetical protein